MVVKIDPSNLNNKGIEEALKQVSDLPRSLNSNLDTTSALVSARSVLKNAVSTINLSKIAINTMSNNLEQISRLGQTINQSSVKTIAKSFSTVSNIQTDSIKNLIELAQQSVSSIDIDYSKITSQLVETLKSLPKPYTEEEISEIISNINTLAEKGWVIYFPLEKIYQRIRSEDIIEVENEWVSLLEEILSDSTKIQSLQESECYPGELIKSMVGSYFHENYYAAYTLATLAIDGAINRVAELKSKDHWIPVGYRAVEKIEEVVLNKTFNDIGFFHWMFQFFKSTKSFTLDKPNRHMIGHGRWDGEISKTEFLKLFNVMLYIDKEFPDWKEAMTEKIGNPL